MQDVTQHTQKTHKHTGFKHSNRSRMANIEFVWLQSTLEKKSKLPVRKP